jgi:PBSX family phage terminase large subunit
MVIADGAIRSGKTVAMALSFLLWSSRTFQGECFILAGRSMGALKRNVLRPLFQICRALGIAFHYNRSEHYIEIGENTYYCFGASTEASQDVVQGLTAAGALLDEAALFPRSFVEQAIGRCSVDGSKVWFNCNPAGPAHYLKAEFIDQAAQKRILHLHFTLDDNLSLSPRVKARYRRLFSGLWFKRYILGLWVMAEGAIYDVWDEGSCCFEELPAGTKIRRYHVGVDYGTTNPTCFLLVGETAEKPQRFLVLREYYWDSRRQQRQKGDAEYIEDLALFLAPVHMTSILKREELAARVVPDPGLPQAAFHTVYVDPSAASFVVAARAAGIPVTQADNAVLDGIRTVHSTMASGRLLVHRSCQNLIRTMPAYVWDPKAQKRGEDAPLKAGADDHPEDALRYDIHSVVSQPSRKVVSG